MPSLGSSDRQTPLPHHLFQLTLQLKTQVTERSGAKLAGSTSFSHLLAYFVRLETFEGNCLDLKVCVWGGTGWVKNNPFRFVKAKDQRLG